MKQCYHVWIYSPAMYTDENKQQWHMRWCLNCPRHDWAKLIWIPGKHPDEHPNRQAEHHEPDSGTDRAICEKENCHLLGGGWCVRCHSVCYYPGWKWPNNEDDPIQNTVVDHRRDASGE